MKTKFWAFLCIIFCSTAVWAELPAVPENGTPAEYVDFMQKLFTFPSVLMPDQSAEEFRKEEPQRMEIALAVADKIMAHPDVTDAFYMQAGTMKMAGLGYRLENGDAAALETMKTLPAAAEKAGYPEAAKSLRVMVWQTELGTAGTKGEKAFLEVLGRINAEIAAKENPDEADFALAQRAAKMAEYYVKDETVLKIYRDYSRMFWAMEGFQERSAYFRLTMHRMSLLGGEMEIAGKLLSGKPFDMAAKDGKVVLVVFWATWCPPCRREIPVIKKLYEEYHADGLEVIGISLDKEKGVLEKFIADEEIPWENMLNTDTDVDGMSMQEYYVLDGIPVQILIGRDGVVVSTDAREERLRGLVEEELALELEEEG